FNSNFKCGDPTILPYELIHGRNRGTVGHIVPPPNADTTEISCTSSYTSFILR
ncbi:hypothetical protein AVEN_5261-1, partial [Araneus ventricosus]